MADDPTDQMNGLLTLDNTASPHLCRQEPAPSTHNICTFAVTVIFMDVSTVQSKKPLYHSLAGRPRKLFRDPLAPYVGCKCGICAWCIDQAKWSARFEKFADSTYYKQGIVTAMRSPLSDF